MTAQYTFVMKDLRKLVPPKREILKGIWLSFYPGAKIGVLGNNGAGKSTLLRIMAGVDKEFLGEAWPAPGLRIGYLPQEPQLDPNKDVKGNVDEGVAETRKLLERFEELSAKLGEDMPADKMDKLLEEQGRLQDQIEAANAWELDHTVDMAMDALRCPPDDSGVEKLSGGERRRVALCRLLLSKPDMLLLDEPTNHLDAESVAWLQHHLEAFPGCVILVTHDRYFLDQVTKWTLELDRGRGHPHEGNYSAWLEIKAKRSEQEASESEGRKKALSRELEWVRQSPKARQAKSKARLTRYDEMAAEAEREKQTFARIQIPPGPRLGQNVIQFDGLKKAFGDKLLIDGLTFKLPPGGIVGIIGPNGAGKTTLLDLICGKTKASAGSIKFKNTELTKMPEHQRVRLGIGRKFQTPSIYENLSVFQNLEVSFPKGRSVMGALFFKCDDEVKARVQVVAEEIGLADVLEKVPPGEPRQLASSYARFALANGHLYDLMFSMPLRKWYGEASGIGPAVRRVTAASVVAIGNGKNAKAHVFRIWGLVHGLLGLYRTETWRAANHGKAVEFIASLV